MYNTFTHCIHIAYALCMQHVQYGRSIKEDDVTKQFLKLNARKVAGPDNITPLTLKSCAYQLSPIYNKIVQSVYWRAHSISMENINYRSST